MFSLALNGVYGTEQKRILIPDIWLLLHLTGVHSFDAPRYIAACLRLLLHFHTLPVRSFTEESINCCFTLFTNPQVAR